MKSAGFSIWEQQSFYHDRDVIIIGLGLVALQTAIQLKKTNRNLQILILEQSILPIGASTRNAGFACFGSVSELLDDVQSFGENRVAKLISDRWQGLQILRETVGDKNMEYQNLGGYEIFHKSKDADSQKKCFDQIDYCNQLVNNAIGRANTFSIRKDDFGFRNISELIYNQYEGQINTAKMFKALLQKAANLGIEVYRGWQCLEIENQADRVEIKTNQSIALKARQVVIATNAFTPRFVENLDLIPARNQVLITKPIKNIRIQSCFHYDQGYIYFRNFQDRLLIGGGRNMDPKEETDEFGTTDNIKNYLREIIREVIFPNRKIEEYFWWSGIIATGTTKEPILQEVKPNVHLAVRLGGMGVALGSLIGKKMATMLKDKF